MTFILEFPQLHTVLQQRCVTEGGAQPSGVGSIHNRDQQWESDQRISCLFLGPALQLPLKSLPSGPNGAARPYSQPSG